MHACLYDQHLPASRFCALYSRSSARSHETRRAGRNADRDEGGRVGSPERALMHFNRRHAMQVLCAQHDVLCYRLPNEAVKKERQTWQSRQSCPSPHGQTDPYKKQRARPRRARRPCARAKSAGRLRTDACSWEVFKGPPLRVNFEIQFD